MLCQKYKEDYEQNKMVLKYNTVLNFFVEIFNQFFVLKVPVLLRVILNQMKALEIK